MHSTKLYESLFILHKCQLNIDILWKMIDPSENSSNITEQNIHLFVYHINLEAVSFLEEYNGDFLKNIEVEYHNRVKEIRKIGAPILKRINKWKDLEKFRNNIIAHPWRNKGKFVMPGKYNIPSNLLEIAVFVNLLKYVWSMIRIEFLKELNQAIKYIDTLKIQTTATTDYSTLNEDHYNMVHEVNSLCKLLNKKYYLKVFLYDLPTTDKT